MANKIMITDYEYLKSSCNFIQGVKNNHTPYNAVAGSNGSFYVSEPPKVICKLVSAKSGKEVGQVDLYWPIKHAAPQRVTKKYVKKLMNKCMNVPIKEDELENFISKISDKL